MEIHKSTLLSVYMIANVIAYILDILFAKEKLFLKINSQLEPIRNKYDELYQDKNYINDVLHDGATKARSYAVEKISLIKEVIGISKIT